MRKRQIPFLTALVLLLCGGVALYFGFKSQNEGVPNEPIASKGSLPGTEGGGPIASPSATPRVQPAVRVHRETISDDTLNLLGRFGLSTPGIAEPTNLSPQLIEAFALDAEAVAALNDARHQAYELERVADNAAAFWEKSEDGKWHGRFPPAPAAVEQGVRLVEAKVRELCAPDQRDALIKIFRAEAVISFTREDRRITVTEGEKEWLFLLEAYVQNSGGDEEKDGWRLGRSSGFPFALKDKLPEYEMYSRFVAILPPRPQ